MNLKLLFQKDMLDNAHKLNSYIGNLDMSLETQSVSTLME